MQQYLRRAVFGTRQTPISLQQFNEYHHSHLSLGFLHHFLELLQKRTQKSTLYIKPSHVKIYARFDLLIRG